MAVKSAISNLRGPYPNSICGWRTYLILFFASSWAASLFNLAIATLLVVAVFRFGLLTAMVFPLVFFLSALYPRHY